MEDHPYEWKEYAVLLKCDKDALERWLHGEWTEEEKEEKENGK